MRTKPQKQTPLICRINQTDGATFTKAITGEYVGLCFGSSFPPY